MTRVSSDHIVLQLVPVGSSSYTDIDNKCALVVYCCLAAWKLVRQILNGLLVMLLLIHFNCHLSDELSVSVTVKC